MSKTIYMITQKIDDEERLIAIFFNKNTAECYMDDTPSINEFKLITLKKEEEE